MEIAYAYLAEYTAPQEIAPDARLPRLRPTSFPFGPARAMVCYGVTRSEADLRKEEAPICVATLRNAEGEEVARLGEFHGRELKYVRDLHVGEPASPCFSSTSRVTIPEPGQYVLRMVCTDEPYTYFDFPFTAGQVVAVAQSERSE